MGCCSGINKNIKLNKDIIIIDGEIKKKEEDVLNIKEPNNDFQLKQKIDKEENNKEKSIITDVHIFQKTEKDESKKDNNYDMSTPSYNELEKNKRNTLEIIKNKMMEKENHRIHNAMKHLKLLSIQEIENNKIFFT